jgi:hypothetical protein
MTAAQRRVTLHRLFRIAGLNDFGCRQPDEPIPQIFEGFMRPI